MMNLFDLLGRHPVKPVAPNARGANGGFQQMPFGAGVNHAPVGTSEALAAYGPQISAQLQAAIARMRAGQVQQDVNANGMRLGDQAQQTIDEQTAAAIAARMGLMPDLLAGLGGDSYMQMPRS